MGQTPVFTFQGCLASPQGSISRSKRRVFLKAVACLGLAPKQQSTVRTASRSDVYTTTGSPMRKGSVRKWLNYRVRVQETS